MKLSSPLYGLVVEQEKRTARNGSIFWQVIIKSRFGLIKCVKWDAAPDAETNPNYAHINDLIAIDVFTDQIAEHGNIKMDHFNRVTQEQLPAQEQSIFDVDSESDEAVKAALAVISDNSFWEDVNHHKFTVACLKKAGLEKFRSYPAAKVVHHNRVGGLLIHTCEVLELCKACAETTMRRYNFINKDVLYSAAILHDLGKIESYKISETGIAEQLNTDRIIGHMFYAMHLIKIVAEEWKNRISSDFVNEVLHCVASHHGTKEWGSIVETQSIESGILSRVDYISSRNGMMEKQLKENIQSQSIPDTFKMYGDSYFLTIGIKKYVAEKTK